VDVWIVGWKQRQARPAFFRFEYAEDAAGFHIEAIDLAEVIDMVEAEYFEDLRAGYSETPEDADIEHSICYADVEATLDDLFGAGT